MSLAVIGGTALAKIESDYTSAKKQEVKTQYGNTLVLIGEIDGKKITILPRHGLDHQAPPHGINYRANIMALKDLGVTNILATAAVGSLNKDIRPGDFVIVDDFMDFTKGRVNTFFEGGDSGLKHVDMTEPYDSRLRSFLIQASKEKGIRYRDGGIYVSVEGPRFETPSEIRFFQKMSADVVGMTGVPEVVLANEVGIPYSTLAIVTNYGAGMTEEKLAHEKCAKEMKKWDEQVFEVLMRAAEIGKLF